MDFNTQELARRLRPLLEGTQVPLARIGLPASELSALGFENDAGQVSLPGNLERLDAEGIRRSLSEQARRWLRSLEVLDIVGSTNTLLGERATSGTCAGCVILAELQIQGRGRRGRHWISPFARNLALSMGFRFELTPDRLGGFSLAVGLAVADALARLGVPEVALKWPNDVLLQGRKVAGILVELYGSGQGNTEVVVGIGVNFRLPDAARARLDQPVIGLDEVGEPPSRNALAAALISSVVDFAAGFEEQGFAPMVPTFDALHHFQQRPCVLNTASGQVRGVVVGVTHTGELSIRVDGQVKAFSSGEVSLRES